MGKKFLHPKLCEAIVQFIKDKPKYYYVNLFNSKTNKDETIVVFKHVLDIEIADNIKIISIIPAYEPDDITKLQDHIINSDLSSFNNN